jgi:hypothetical protein
MKLRPTRTRDETEASAPRTAVLEQLARMAEVCRLRAQIHAECLDRARQQGEPPPQPRQSEAGSLLIIVLWIAFGLVALTLYFAHAMSLELRAADNRIAAVEAGQAIEGAARYLSNILTTVAYPGYLPDPLDYGAEAVPVGNATFWLVGRDTNDWELNLTTPAFGLVDEAAKINLNAPWLTAEMIEYLPGMTTEMAAAIMDWRDTNSDLSTSGAEDETYTRPNQPYKTKKAAF